MPAISIETRFTEHLKTLENEMRAIRENLLIINSGKGRTGHFNKVTESITRMKETITIIKRLNLRDEAMNEQISKRIKEILDASILAVKEKNAIKEIVQEKTESNRISKQEIREQAEPEPDATPKPETIIQNMQNIQQNIQQNTQQNTQQSTQQDIDSETQTEQTMQSTINEPLNSNEPLEPKEVI